MKRALSFIFALILITLTFSSCGGEESMEIYYPVTEDFTSLDPQIVSGVSSETVAYNCYEGLVRLNENGEITAGGAVRWDISQDGKKYTFYLREDAEWYLTNTAKEELSETDPEKSPLPADFDSRVTANDYVYGLQRAVDPATGCTESENYSAIENAADIISGKKTADQLGVKAVNDYTLEITLAYENPDFLYSLTRLPAMPCNKTFFEACRGRYGLAMEYLLCNGAYIVYRWTPQSLIRLEKNALYTGEDKAQNDRVWVYFVEDASSVPDKIKNGTYDAGYLSANEVSSFENKEGYDIKSRSNVIWGYWFNCKSDVFSVSDMRKAFASAADKSVIEPPAYIEKETDRILTNALSPYFEYSPSPIEYDESKADEYYKKALAENENISASMTVTVLTTEDFADSVIKQIQIWQRVFGIDVKIQTETRENAVKLFNSGKYEIAFIPFDIESSKVLDFLRSFTTGFSENITGYSNTEYDGKVKTVTSSMSDSEKNEIYKSCEQMLISDGLTVPLYTEASYFVTGKDVTGIYELSEGEVYFRNGIII